MVLGNNTYNRTPRTHPTTRTLEGDYVYRGIKIAVLHTHSYGVIYPDGRKKKYMNVRAAKEGINQHLRRIQ